jgi:radical SAM-linked protein
LRFSKTDPVRFVSHLDVVRLLGRSLRRASVGVAYSTGYSRHPKLSFGPPLPVGMVGRDEYFDVELTEERPGDFVNLLNSHLPDGIRILDAVPIVTKVQSLMSLIDHADYRLSFPPHARRLLGDPEPSSFRSSLEESIRHFFSHDRAYVIQRGPDGERPVEITTGVRRLVAESDGDDAFPVLSLTLRVAGEGAVRPLDLASFLLGEDRLDPRLLRVERLLLYSLRGDSMVTPLEAAAGEELIGALEGPADGPSSSAGRPDVQRDRHQRRPGRDPHRHSRRW